MDGAAGVSVPEMYADRLIGLVRGAVVVVCDVPVVAPVPTGLQSDVGVVDGVETELADWTIRPDIGQIILDSLCDLVVGVNVEDVPL